MNWNWKHTVAASLTCAGAGGSASQQVAVTVTSGQPSVSLTASPTSVGVGGKSSLSWLARNVTTCIASGAWSGPRPNSGSATARRIQSDSTFTLSCTGTGGTAVAMANVAVRAATLSWTLPTSPTNLAGFKVDYGAASQNYTNQVTLSDPAATSYRLALQPGTYYFAITAIDAQGSPLDYSNEVSKTIY